MASLRRFQFDYEQLLSFCKKFKASNNDQVTLLEIKQAELDRRWQKFVASCDEVMALDDEDVPAEERKTATDNFSDASDKYQGCKSRIVDLIKSKSVSKADESMRADMTMSQGFSSLKLPPCDTQPFEGGYSKWPPFRDIFTAVFGNHPELSAAQKLYHLRSKTRGEAYQIVKKFDLVDENFQLAWEALRNRYENPRILVHQQMKVLFGIQTVQVENPKSIRQVQSGINDSLSIFQSYKIKTENWDPILIHLCSTKLPEETLRAWEDSLSNHKELPTWSQMNTFLSKRIEIIETISDFRKSGSRDSHGSHQKSQVFHSHLESEGTKYSCKKCRQNHPLRYCKYFKSLSISDRMKYVYANKYCVNCLSSTHFKSNCTSDKSCSRCNKKHHTMLHLEDEGKNDNSQRNRGQYKSYNHENGYTPRQEPPASSKSAKAQVETVQAHFSQNEGTTILPTALVNIEHAGELFSIRALLDAGSEKSFISKRIQQTIAIPVRTHHSQISGLGGTIVGNSNSCCDITLRSRDSNFSIRINAIVVSKLAHFLPSKCVRVEYLPDIPNLTLADPYFFKPAPIDMIIGSDYLPFINLDGVRSNIGRGLEARESKFGWYLSGPLQSSTINTFSTMVSTSDDVALHEQLKKFWELEECEITNSTSDNDIYCEEFYKETTYRQPDGRYIVRLPFKAEFPEKIFLGQSRNMALAQFHRMEKTLLKTPDLKIQYDKVLQEYLDMDHMEQVNHFEKDAEKHFTFFLPHHAVVKPESKTTKVRVVFNGTKKTNSGFSLNDVLYPGPILQADLMQIVLSWRYYQYVFTGDIQKMYRQVLLHRDDRQYQRILFRPQENEAVKSFELKTVTFGVNCAPFLAIRTLRQLSEDCEKEQPEASKILKDEIYVDDVLSGGHTLHEAKIKQDQLIRALNSAAFPLKKITANNYDLLKHFAREDLLDEDFLKIDDSSTMKTLGIRWNAMSDCFYYVVDSMDVTPSATKRQILSVIARLFDPLGWLGPIVVVAKVLMQKLWEEKTGWDEGVPPHLLTTWNSFLRTLPEITALRIPRWVEFSPDRELQIHGFSDASEKAYCGAVYLRTRTSTGELSSHLLVAKTRVAPIKRTTIPKLELCGAVLLANLVKNIIKTFDGPYELHMWTDSSIVLGWLQKSPQTLKTFVANRVTEIINITSVNLWKHVRTEDNPADLGTRGCPSAELIQNSLWWNGPSWLQSPLETWPEPRTFDPTDLETKRVSTFYLEVNEDIISRFSSLSRALRVISYIFRFFQSCRKIPPPERRSVATEEITFVKNRLIILAQQKYYPREYECLTNKIPISRKSHILTLNPILDSNGLLRVGGRLENSGLSYGERHPVIVPEKSTFAELFIRYSHEILLHAEYNIMLRAIRQGFYIPRLKNVIRKCIRGCKACTIYKRKFQDQMMAALPPERVTFSLPFTYAGVDFAGPFNLKSSVLRNAKIVKGYAAIFVCFSTRAVHIEVCSDLSADCFLAAFSRFTGRRGLPKTMFSDNGRNFVGASYKLLQEHNNFLKNAEKSLLDKYSLHGFTWSFIPPYAPHMGGLWEAAVKSMKSHLKKITKNMSFTFEEFTTLLIRIEAVLNSRPLSPMSENPSELLPLTPGHLLRGAPLTAPPESSEVPPPENLSHLNRWKRLKTIQHIFSQRWKSEYVTELQRRYKWKTTQSNITENDFVIIKDDSLPPTEWRLGRIARVIYGKDGNVRVAEIKTQNGMIVRPVVKLCVLPTSTNQQLKPQSNDTNKQQNKNDRFLEC